MSVVHVFIGPVVFVLYCFISCPRVLWHGLTGAGAPPPQGHQGCSSLGCGHAFSSLSSATFSAISGAVSVYLLPLHRVCVEAQTLSSVLKQEHGEG